MPKKMASSNTSHLWPIMAAIFFVAIGIFMSRRYAPVVTLTVPIQQKRAVLSFPHYEFQQLADLTVSSAQDRAAAVWLDSSSGSGTFFYLVGGMIDGGKEVYSEPVFLGDRIKIQSVRVSDNSVTVQYLDRPASAPMSDSPTVLTSVTYEFQKDGSLKIAQ